MNERDSRASGRADDGRRLTQILAVLRRHQVTRGLTPEKLRAIFEDLGPTFVKVGQILSMRPDMIPAAYCDELRKLRTDVQPMTLETVRTVIESEYGKPIQAIFSTFDATPVGSASIAQVHRAVLPGGETVVVKVQRPDIYEMMRRDINLLRRAGKLMKLSQFGRVVDVNIVLDEMWETARQEMDFELEASHLEEFRRNNKDIKYVYCPHVYHELTTARVLVMERVDGIQIDDLEALRAKGYDLDEIGRKLASNYIKQIIDDRYFHADPHPGNIFIKDGRIVWLDMGMMGRLSDFDAQCYKNGIAAVVGHDCEAIKDIILSMGVCKGHVDEMRMVEDCERFLNKYGQMSLADMNLGLMMNEMIELTRSYDVRMPPGMTMIGRGITTLEGVLTVISPSVSVIGVLASQQTGALLENIDWKKEAANLAKDLASSGQKIARLPAQISDALTRLARGRTRVNMEISGSEKLVSALDRSLRRLSAGLVAAGLLLGSYMLYGQAAHATHEALCWLGFLFGSGLAAWALFGK